MTDQVKLQIRQLFQDSFNTIASNQLPPYGVISGILTKKLANFHDCFINRHQPEKMAGADGRRRKQGGSKTHGHVWH